MANALSTISSSLIGKRTWAGGSNTNSIMASPRILPSGAGGKAPAAWSRAGPVVLANKRSKTGWEFESAFNHKLARCRTRVTGGTLCVEPRWGVEPAQGPSQKAVQHITTVPSAHELAAFGAHAMVGHGEDSCRCSLLRQLGSHGQAAHVASQRGGADGGGGRQAGCAVVALVDDPGQQVPAGDLPLP